jgi:hypothetical protein
MSQINVGFDNLSPQAIDRSYGKTIMGVTTPYVSTAEANASVNINFRHKGKTVIIDDGSGPKEYWWKAGTANVDLVLKDQTGVAGLNEFIYPWKIETSINVNYTIVDDTMAIRIVVIPLAEFNLFVGITPGGSEVVPGVPMLAGQANVVDIAVPAWGADQTIYFTGITGFVRLLIYRVPLTPINP